MTRSGAVSLRAHSAPHIAILQFDTGTKLNTLDLATMREIDAALGRVAADTRVLVLAGRGDHFSSGLELTDVLAMDEAAFAGMVEFEYGLFRRVQSLPFLSVAAVNGVCVGNCAELVLCCDFRVSGPALRFGFPEVPIGFAGPAQRLSRYVGIAVAKQLLIQGTLLDAPAARALRLVDDVIDGAADRSTEGAVGDPLPGALDLAERLAALPPRAVSLTKMAIEHSYFGPDDYDADERAGAVESFLTTDLREGVAAVLAKRPPVYTGT